MAASALETGSLETPCTANQSAFSGSDLRPWAGLARELMDFCREQKPVRKVGGLYELNRQELDDRGIYWEGLRVEHDVALAWSILRPGRLGSRQ